MIAGLALLLSAGVTYAKIDLSGFQTIYTPQLPELKKPTVVSVILPENEARFGNVILEQESDSAEPWLAITQKKENKIHITATSSLIGSKDSLTDSHYETSAEFNLDQDLGKAWVEMESDREMSSSSLSLTLDENVAIPYKIALYAWVKEGWKTVVAEKRLESDFLTFPQTKAGKWRLALEHSQPLRLKEIILNETTAGGTSGVEVRWLARPEKSYTIYTNSRHYVSVKAAEAGQLDGKEIQVIPVPLGQPDPNPVFREPDSDKDSIPDLKDNCVSTPNSDQKDVDSNSRGDACEDFDGDRMINNNDNCPDRPNQFQEDTDGDGMGDACDNEESRPTEQYPWLPWTAMGIAAILIVGMVIKTIHQKK